MLAVQKMMAPNQTKGVEAGFRHFCAAWLFSGQAFPNISFHFRLDSETASSSARKPSTAFPSLKFAFFPSIWVAPKVHHKGFHLQVFLLIFFAVTLCRYSVWVGAHWNWGQIQTALSDTFPSAEVPLATDGVLVGGRGTPRPGLEPVRWRSEVSE